MTDKCRCDTPGFCQLLQRQMSKVRHDECKNKPHYFEMFLKESRSPKREQPPPEQGPGAELKLLLSKFGYKASLTCKCNRHATEMNRRGTEWCIDNVDTIVRWLGDEAEIQGQRFSSVAARLVVKLAIRRSVNRQKHLAR